MLTITMVALGAKKPTRSSPKTPPAFEAISRDTWQAKVKGKTFSKDSIPTLFPMQHVQVPVDEGYNNYPQGWYYEYVNNDGKTCESSTVLPNNGKIVLTKGYVLNACYNPNMGSGVQTSKKYICDGGKSGFS